MNPFIDCDDKRAYINWPTWYTFFFFCPVCRTLVIYQAVITVSSKMPNILISLISIELDPEQIAPKRFHCIF